jgi:transcription elongation factor Elf1
MLKLARKYLSQNRRNKNIKIENIIMCPKCKESNFTESDIGFLTCGDCGTRYQILSNGIIKFN